MNEEKERRRKRGRERASLSNMMMSMSMKQAQKALKKWYLHHSCQNPSQLGPWPHFHSGPCWVIIVIFLKVSPLLAPSTVIILNCCHYHKSAFKCSQKLDSDLMLVSTAPTRDSGPPRGPAHSSAHLLSHVLHHDNLPRYPARWSQFLC